MSKINILLAVVIAAGFLNMCHSYEDFRFSKEIDCVHQNNKGHCKEWLQTTTLYRYTSLIYYCFPGDSWVLTRNGPLQMMDLTLEDQILGMNLQTGKSQFTQVKAWLHRDSSSLMQYSLIEVQNSTWKFMGSDFHNIAFSNQNQTDFKFLKDLNQNDTLISLANTGQEFRVQRIQRNIEKEGLYSPLTKTGNFYIYPENFDQRKFESQNQQYPMILVHSLSQIKNPIKNFDIALSYVGISGVVFGHQQPSDDQEYVNPLISRYNILFGNDWVGVQGQKIVHRYSSNSYSSHNNNKYEERKRKTMAIVALQTVLSRILI